MKPGRDLDALVAEKVMGWVDFTKFEGQLLGLDPTDSCPSKGYTNPPKYSTDIAAAWEVVELPHFDGWAIGRNSEGKWEVFNPWTDNHVVAVSDTAPHAICLAALKAVGGLE